MKAEDVIKTTEADVQRQVLKYLKVKGYYFGRVNTVGVYDAKIGKRRKNPYALLGLPDILGFYTYKWSKRIVSPLTFGGEYGRMFAIECKSEKGKLTPQQKDFRKWFESCGNLYIIARDLDDVTKYL